MTGSRGDREIEAAERLLERREAGAAIRAFHEAEAAGADADRCSGGRWLGAMLLGEFEGAWRESDGIRGRHAPDQHRFWDGSNIRGRRVMVRSLHGLGDAVQMLRYAPSLAETAAGVIYEVAPRFVELASCFAGVGEVITWGEDAPAQVPDWNLQVEVMELPYLFRTRPGELPIATNYLALPPVRLAAVGGAMGPRVAGRMRVGVMGVAGGWNPERSLPAGALEGVLSVGRDCEFWSLEHSGLVPRGMRNAKEVCGDGLVALGATIAHLDLVITVDTLAAHLAGALGVPAWVMLQHAADWRWMIGRYDSPWYPTLRLFRQQTPGDWRSVVEALGAALGEFQAQVAGRLMP